MMKDEFLRRLKELLSDLPQEEREEAVRYYEDYFADAGPLEETRVLRELISPEDVAEKIRAGCGGRKADGEEAFAENIFGSGAEIEAGRKGNLDKLGSAETEESLQMQTGAGNPEESDRPGSAQGEEKNPQMQAGAGNLEESDRPGSAQGEENPQMQTGAGNLEESDRPGSAQGEENPQMWTRAANFEENWVQSRTGTEEENWGQEDARAREQRMRMDEAFAQDYEKDAEHAQNGRRARGNRYEEESYPNGATVRTKNYLSPVIVILALVIGLPFLCPLLLMFIIVMGSFFVGFGICGVGLVAGGVALVGNALANMSMGSGLLCLLSGGGLILAALGILFIVFAVNCAFRAIPALFRGIRRVLLALRGRRA